MYYCSFNKKKKKKKKRKQADITNVDLKAKLAIASELLQMMLLHSTNLPHIEFQRHTVTIN